MKYLYDDFTDNYLHQYISKFMSYDPTLVRKVLNDPNQNINFQKSLEQTWYHHYIVLYQTFEKRDYEEVYIWILLQMLQT